MRLGSRFQPPSDFARRTVELFGTRGQAWLIDLPALLERCAQRWSIEIDPPFAPLSYNYVAPARREDGTPVVLKVGVPNPELSSEIAALRHFAARGIVRLVDGDATLGALLLERLEPGTPLSVLDDDDEATTIAAGVMRDLWQSPPDSHPFPTVARWGRGLARLRATFDGGCGPFPVALVERAERLFAELLATAAAPQLLHGDLHHDNILAARRAPWLALDPKGVVGEPAFEVGALLRNPRDRLAREPESARLLARRLDLLAERLELDRERLLQWGLAGAVLSAWWSYEDHGRADPIALGVARALAEVDRGG